MAIDKILETEVLHLALSTAQWQTYNGTVIPKGFLCAELADGGVTRIKIGDGVNTFAQLSYTYGNVDLSDYYTKNETKNEITSAVAAIGTAVTIKGTAPLLSDLPSSGNKQGDLWFVENDAVHTGSGYAEYIWINSTWEFIGKNQAVDLSEYATVTYTENQINTLSSRMASAETRITSAETKISEIETDYIKSTDKLILQCSL